MKTSYDEAWVPRRYTHYEGDPAIADKNGSAIDKIEKKFDK